jgi:hypothetical protein
LPDGAPVWADFASLDVEPVIARPGIVAAASTGEFPARLRAKGAKTVYWDMNLNNRVGTPAAPADPALMDERAGRLFVAAASQTACATPWIALNELFGAHLETPWTPNNAQYRANVLAFLRGLAARGARPFLLVNSEPYVGSDEAAAWWRSVAEVADIVREVYFNGKQLYAQGPILANRRLRAAYRRAVARLVAIGIPVTRIGIILGFQSAPGAGGREGLARQPWFEVIKWQGLSIRQIAGEMKIATVWSWGWGTYSEAGRDQDKPVAACVYLWSRDRRLCDAPRMAGKQFNVSRTQGQLSLPGGTMCKIGANTISMSAIARLNVFVQDRDVAYTVLLSRLAESARTRVTSKEILAAERAIVQHRFGGSYSSYRSALARGRASVPVARSILADTIRRRKLGAKLRVAKPSSTAIAGFYAEYPDVLVRTVQARGDDAPWWLAGRKTGLALSTFAPAQLFALPAGRTATVRTLTGNYAMRALDEARPLGSVSLTQARPAISAALTQFARSDAVVNVSSSAQEALLRQAVCSRDDLPTPAVIDLTTYLPFLRLEG